MNSIIFGAVVGVVVAALGHSVLNGWKAWAAILVLNVAHRLTK